MRFILTMLVSMFSFSVWATEISVDVGSRRDSVSNQFTRISEVRIQDDVLGVQLTTGNVSRAEIDYTWNFPSITFLTVKTGVGAVTSGIGHYTYSISPKLSYMVSDKVGVYTSFKYRDSIKTNTLSDKTQTFDVGLTYAANKNLGLFVKAEHSIGDQRYNAGFIGATYSF